MFQNIHINCTPDEKELQFIRDEIKKYNAQIVGDNHEQPVKYSLTNEDGVFIGGLFGATYWNWLFVDTLWIHPHYRNQGIGQAVLLTAEQEAVHRGCDGAHLYTHQYKAVGFYLNNGFRKAYVFDQYRNVFERYFMVKELKVNPISKLPQGIIIKNNLTDAEVERLKHEYQIYIHEVYGEDSNYTRINEVVYNQQQEIIAGVLGGIDRSWAYIEKLWIHPQYRKQGMGTELLAKIENEGKRRQCLTCQLFAYDFQDVPYFLHQGYEIKYQLPVSSISHTKCLLLKEWK
jgi:GNAT superfamily N-acetyltransferase